MLIHKDSKKLKILLGSVKGGTLKKGGLELLLCIYKKIISYCLLVFLYYKCYGRGILFSLESIVVLIQEVLTHHPARDKHNYNELAHLPQITKPRPKKTQITKIHPKILQFVAAIHTPQHSQQEFLEKFREQNHRSPPPTIGQQRSPIIIFSSLCQLCEHNHTTSNLLRSSSSKLNTVAPLSAIAPPSQTRTT